MTARARALAALLVMTSLLVAGGVDAKRRSKRQARAKAPPAYVIERLPDGLTLVVVKQPGDRVAVRYGVRAGGFHDPVEKSGAAHLVQRLVFHGSYELPAGELEARARAAGATVGAQTHTTWSTFALDAPRESFLELLEPYVELITNPALQFADLERAKQRVASEPRYGRAEELVWALDQLAFPTENRGRTRTGSAKSRAALHVEDLAALYERRYTPATSVVLVVGDVDVTAVRAVLERAVLQPPVPAPERRRDDVEPNAPASARAKDDRTGTASGYALGDVDPGTCDDIAALLELRVKERVRFRTSLASEASVRCERLRGHSFVVAYALAKDVFGGRLPDVLAEVMEAAPRTPPSKQERRLLLARHRALRGWEAAEPERLADALTRRLFSQDGSLEENLSSHFRAPRFDWSEMRPVMQRALREERRVVVELTPH